VDLESKSRPGEHEGRGRSAPRKFGKAQERRLPALSLFAME
jgi:hypothetical protein